MLKACANAGDVEAAERWLQRLLLEIIHFLKNILYFPLLVLKGIYHYWTYSCFSQGLKHIWTGPVWKPHFQWQA